MHATGQLTGDGQTTGLAKLHTAANQCSRKLDTIKPENLAYIILCDFVQKSLLQLYCTVLNYAIGSHVHSWRCSSTLYKSRNLRTVNSGTFQRSCLVKCLPAAAGSWWAVYLPIAALTFSLYVCWLVIFLHLAVAIRLLASSPMTSLAASSSALNGTGTNMPLSFGVIC